MNHISLKYREESGKIEFDFGFDNLKKLVSCYYMSLRTQATGNDLLTELKEFYSDAREKLLSLKEGEKLFIPIEVEDEYVAGLAAKYQGDSIYSMDYITYFYISGSFYVLDDGSYYERNSEHIDEPEFSFTLTKEEVSKIF